MPLSDSETLSRRTNPVAGRGMISTPHHLASQSGLAVLRKGGTAVDAAVAAAAVLAVVYPQMCGLGGDAFWLIHDPRSGESRALNASGRAAGAACRATFEKLGRIPERGWLAPEAFIAAEVELDAAVKAPDGLELLTERHFGQTRILIWTNA